MNTKKLILILSFTFIILVISICGYFLYHYYLPVTVTSFDHTFQITVPGTVKFKIQNADTTDYSLDIYSTKDEMFFYSTVIEKRNTIDLKENINTEKSDLPNIRKDIKNISDLSEISIGNAHGFEYHYNYYDEDYRENLYTKVVWIETEKNIYILDFEVIEKNQSKYIPIFEKIINSFKEL